MEDFLFRKISSFGYTVEKRSKHTWRVYVTGNRNEAVVSLSTIPELEYDPNLRGSSIGGFRCNGLKILVKSFGRSAGLDEESRAMSLLSSVISAEVNSHGPIDILLPSRIVLSVVGVAKTPGTPKSDFHLYDSQNRPVCFISHKKGHLPTHFQQWGGLTESAIAEHPDVEEFADACRVKLGELMPPKTAVFMGIRDPLLKQMSVFGVDFGKDFGENNVDVLLQGDPGLERHGQAYMLTANHVHYNGDVPTGEFEPVLSMIYKGDRTNLGVKGARGSVYPLGGRKMIHINEYR